MNLLSRLQKLEAAQPVHVSLRKVVRIITRGDQDEARQIAALGHLEDRDMIVVRRLAPSPFEKEPAAPVVTRLVASDAYEPLGAMKPLVSGHRPGWPDLPGRRS